MRHLNTAQKNIAELKSRIPASKMLVHNFLQECFDAWDGYEDSSYSYPFWKLRDLEKKYGLNVPDLNQKYNQHEQPIL